MAPGRQGFSEFVAANAGRLMSIAYLLTGDRATAEDVLQDALERTYLAWPRVDEPFSYVRTALTRQAINRWRRRSRRREVSLDDWWDGVPVPDHSHAAVERLAIQDALGLLPPRQRAVIVLRFLDDLSEAETARCLGCSVGTVKSQSSRALARLRGHLYPTDRPSGRRIEDPPEPSPPGQASDKSRIAPVAVTGGPDAL